MTEKWKTIPGHPNYKVSTHGRVKAKARVVHDVRTGTRRLKSRLLNLTLNGNGYVYVNLRVRKRRFVMMTVHSLVLTTFVGPRPPGYDSRHFPDKNRQNNYLSNLSWSTHKRNCKDRMVQGWVPPSGEAAAKKLDWKKVGGIRRMVKEGWSQHKTARRFNISQGIVSKIVNNILWKV